MPLWVAYLTELIMAKARFQNVKVWPEFVDGKICNFNFRAFRNIVVGKRGFKGIACEDVDVNDIDDPSGEATFLALEIAAIACDLDIMTEERMQKMERYFLKAKENAGFNYIPPDAVA